MKRLLRLLPACLGLLAFGQDPPNRIGKIEFFGYSDLDPTLVRAALPVHEGDNFPAADADIIALIDRVKEVIVKTIGRSATDVAMVCCDQQSTWMIYVGLSGKSVKPISYNPAPTGAVLLPPSAVKLYDEAMDAVMEAARSGAAEDDSRGYALSTHPGLKGKQLAIRQYALQNERTMRSVLSSSRNSQHRARAAHLLGYARASDKQVAALVRASRDADETVRNNAVRALGVIAKSNRELARRIPAAEFIPLLSSGAWKDRNKAGFLLETLTQNRDVKLLSALDRQAHTDLVEMARWRNPGHAYPARILLGRIAGVPEDHLQELIQTGKIESIIPKMRAGP